MSTSLRHVGQWSNRTPPAEAAFNSAQVNLRSATVFYVIELHVISRLSRNRSQKLITGSLRMSVPGMHPEKKNDSLCIFASFDPSGQIAPHVINYLRAIQTAGFDIIFIQSSDRKPESSCFDSIKTSCRLMVNRKNVGYDFSSWKLGMMLCEDLHDYQKLLITNDSIIGPWSSLEPLLESMSADPSALWGLTESLETGTPHLQSYFIFCQHQVFSSRFFRSFWNSVTIVPHKWQIVLAYEVGLSKSARTAGIPVRAWLPYEQVRQRCLALGPDFRFTDELAQEPLNPTLHTWDIVVRDFGFPFIKAELLRGNRLDLPGIDSWPDLVADSPSEVLQGALAYEESSRWLIPERREPSLPLPSSPKLLGHIGPRLYARLNHRYDQMRRFAHDIRSGDRAEIVRKLGKSGKFNWLVRSLSVHKNQASSNLSPRELYFKEASLSLQTFLSKGATIELPVHESPLVTIVLILFNKAELTYRCLESLASLRDEIPFHVVIVDNASSDDTQLLLDRLAGATVLRNTENTGFLRACNQAAERVTSPHILFLNNDTILYPGSIRAALENFQNPDVGAVGGRIILPDDVLQEAGSIFWNDGTCVGYGRGLPPETDECMYRRSVDYCSGVFLMTPTVLFRQVGGFDMRYAPAYYEESDYCAQLQARGLQIVYDPRVVVRHVEFGSSQQSSSAFALMNANRQKFLEKNSALLQTKYPPQTSQRLARSVKNSRKRWLFLDDRPPLPHLGAGYPRMNRIVSLLAKTGKYDITIACTENFIADWETIRRDIPIDIEVLDLTVTNKREQFLREQLRTFDVVWVSRPSNMQHLLDVYSPKSLNSKNYVLVYDSEAIFADRALAEARVFGISSTRAEAELSVELQNGACADVLVAVCRSNAERWSNVARGQVHIIGNDAQILPGAKDFQNRRNILFAGSLHDILSPNTDSLFWFMKNVMPFINEALPGVKVDAVGYVDGALKPFIGRNTTHFSLIGRVPELRPFFLDHRIAIVPTRFAAGIPQKVFDAASTGIPTVCSPLIASQMEWTDRVETLVGSTDDARHFAEQCIDLYSNEALWSEVFDSSLASMRNYASQYAVERGFYPTLTAIEELLAGLANSKSSSPLSGALNSSSTKTAA